MGLGYGSHHFNGVAECMGCRTGARSFPVLFLDPGEKHFGLGLGYGMQHFNGVAECMECRAGARSFPGLFLDPGEKQFGLGLGYGSGWDAVPLVFSWYQRETFHYRVEISRDVAHFVKT